MRVVDGHLVHPFELGHGPVDDLEPGRTTVPARLLVGIIGAGERLEALPERRIAPLVPPGALGCRLQQRLRCQGQRRPVGGEAVTYRQRRLREDRRGQICEPDSGWAYGGHDATSAMLTTRQTGRAG